MGTEEGSRKIQDVINKANIVWNNDHKESQKNIFVRNIIKYPLNYFFPLQFFTFSLFFFMFFCSGWLVLVEGIFRVFIGLII